MAALFLVEVSCYLGGGSLTPNDIVGAHIVTWTLTAGTPLPLPGMILRMEATADPAQYIEGVVMSVDAAVPAAPVLVLMTRSTGGSGTVTAWTCTAGTLRFSTAPYITLPTELPGSVRCEPRIMQAGEIARFMFDSGTTGGASRVEAGDIVLGNADGALDPLLDYGFDARAVLIRAAEQDEALGIRPAYPGGFTTVLAGTAGRSSAEFGRLTLALRTRQFDLDVPLQASSYAGTTNDANLITSPAGGGFALMNGATNLQAGHAAPDGSVSWRLRSTVNGGSNTAFGEYSGTVPNDAVSRAFSVHLRKGTTPTSAVRLFYDTGGTLVSVTGTVTWGPTPETPPGLSGCTAAYAGDGWWRVAVTLANNATGNTVVHTRLYSRDAGTANVIGQYVDHWGWQREDSATLTPYGAPATLEGGPNDLKGKPKPLVYGSASNATPPCVSTSRLIYQVSAGLIAAVPAVYDRGVPLTAGADYATLADLTSISPAAAGYRVWKSAAGSYFRLGSSPAGLITCDVTEQALAADRSVPAIVARIVAAVAPAVVIVTADITALQAQQPAEVEVFQADPTSAAELLDRLCASVGAWWGFDRLGQFRLRRLDAPAGVAPVAVLRVAEGQHNPLLAPTDADIISFELSAADQTGGLPVREVTLSYAPNWTVQSTDLAGAVTQARRGILAEFSRDTAPLADAAVRLKHPLADTLRVETLLKYEADAIGERDRVLALRKVRRDRVSVRTRMLTTAGAADLGDEVTVILPRFGYALGRPMRVIGQRLDARARYVTLELWG